MRFSEHYKIVAAKSESWFDPILDHDTKLFIDPFLIFKKPRDGFTTAHAKLISFFNQAFTLAAESGGNQTHPAYKKLHYMLVFPEVPEICLGYTGVGTKGSGTGRDSAKLIAAGVLEAIARGITGFSHFEEIDLLQEGIGCDRISDITANILKPELIAYTQEICRRHGVPLQRALVRHTAFDTEFLRWESDTIELPVNSKGEGILLVPKAYLRSLPVVNANDFWDYCWDSHNEQMRNDFNYDVKRRVNKKDIISLARKNQFLVRAYLEDREGKPAPVAYDLERDERGVYRWQHETAAYAAANPLLLSAPGNRVEFTERITTLIDRYRLFIEDGRGYKLLWNDSPQKPKSEEAAQLTFLGIGREICRANDIDLSPETDFGRGPVDFKFSNGFALRAHLEVKLARNTKFWHGLREQLPDYMRAEEITLGFFLVICYSDADVKKVAGIQQVASEVARENGLELHVQIVNALPDKPSATKARKGRDKSRKRFS